MVSVTGSPSAETDPVGSGRGEPQEVLEAVAAQLRERGERMTGPRRAVLTVLLQQQGHLGAEDVVAAVAALDPRVHRASVYRTLETLTQLGVVQHVHVGHGGTSYHLLDSHAHLHVQCARCGAVTDVGSDILDPVARELFARYGFRLDPSHVALSGSCRSCLTARQHESSA